MFHQCQRLIHGINSRSKGAVKSEQIIVKNVVSYLASMVQDLSQNFKKAQSKYLKRMFLVFCILGALMIGILRELLELGVQFVISLKIITCKYLTLIVNLLGQVSKVVESVSV